MISEPCSRKSSSEPSVLDFGAGCPAFLLREKLPSIRRCRRIQKRFSRCVLLPIPAYQRASCPAPSKDFIAGLVRRSRSNTEVLLQSLAASGKVNRRGHEA